MTATYLADKSALARMKHAAVAARLEPMLHDGEIARCGVVELEVLYSARSERDLLETRASRAVAYERVAMSETDFLRAEEIMSLLARRGQHGAASLPDLLIAAAAERAALTVLHYDADYDLIATVTGQQTEWIAPKGTL